LGQVTKPSSLKSVQMKENSEHSTVITYVCSPVWSLPPDTVTGQLLYNRLDNYYTIDWTITIQSTGQLLNYRLDNY